MGKVRKNSKQSVTTTVTEELLERYFTITETVKELDKEMKELKKVFNIYFDDSIGREQKGELSVGNYKLQRQVRCSESFDDEKTIARLEENQLNDCIQYVKIPDKEKIEAAVTLGLLNQEDIEDCIIKKYTTAISVRRS